MELEYAKKDYEISVYKYELSTDYSTDDPNEAVPEDVKKISYFKQEKLARIGSNKYKSPIDACSPKVTININGKKTLTFNLYYRYLDYQTGEYEYNPLINIVQNDSLIELKLGEEYYDLIITKIQKNSEGTVYNYTAEDANIIELGKNGFNAELDTELENNMGTIQELGKAILKDSDWRVAPQIPDQKTGLYSDLIIQSLEDALYSATVSLSSNQFSKRSNYLPDAYYIYEATDFSGENITNGTIYIFYNDWINKLNPNDEIGFLYCGAADPELNADGTIVNSYNYVTKRSTLQAAAQNLALSDYRGRRVVKSPKTGYDHDLRKAITYYEKKIGDEWVPGYYGYTETDYLSPILVDNYLSNPHNMTSLYDWVQLYGAEEGVNQPKSVPHLLLEVMPFPTVSPYVSYIKANGEFLNKGLHGNRTKIKSLRTADEFVLAILRETKGYTNPVPNYFNETIDYDVSTDVDKIQFKAGFYKYNNGDRNSITMYSDMKCEHEGVLFGDQNGYARFSPIGSFTIKDPLDQNKQKIFDYMIFNPTSNITDITEEYGLDYKLGAVFKSDEDVNIYDVMFFRKELDNEGNLIYPGRVTPLVDEQYTHGIAQELLKTYYYIYEDSLNPLESSSGISRVVDRLDDITDKYRVVYNDNFEKVSSVKGKESNYYTLLSNLTKTFECWAQYVVARDSEGRILYDNHYYNSKTGEEIFYSPTSTEQEGYFYNSNGLKLAGKERYYKWERLSASQANGPIKILDYFEDFNRFLSYNEEGTTSETRWVLSTDEYQYRDIKDFDTEYIYQIRLVGQGTYPEQDPVYCQLKLYYRDIDSTDLEISVIKKPSKWVCFKNYLNDTPNWSGFKYGINIKSIQRIEDNAKFSTKVIVKNNNNEFAKNKFCSIARAEDNPTKDNFIIDFGYYIRQGLLDKTELTKDLYDETNGYFPRIRRLNEQNENITETYIKATTTYDRARAEWETYYLGAQAAQENIEKYIKMIKNCGDEFYIDLGDEDNPWHVGGLWAIRDKVYVVKTMTDAEDMGSATSYEFFVGLNIDQNERIITIDDNNTDDEEDDTRVKSSLDGIELPVVYFYNGKSTDEFKKGSLYYVDPDTSTTQKYKPNNHTYYYFPDYVKPIDHSSDPDYDYEDYEEEKDLAELFDCGEIKRYHTYGPDGEDYLNKSNYLFNACVYSYCQRIDEHLLKKDIFNKLEQPAKMALESAKTNMETIKLNSISYVEQKNAILREFLSKYSYFLRESTWTKDDYTDDNLYYLDARDSLHAAAFPKISYNINVVNMADYENYNCYKLKVGDYTFVEDTEFFGWDDYGRPAKEWVVVTEAVYDLEQPENDQIKIQNYKSQLEDLFTRISASIQNLELTIGGYNRRINGSDNYDFQNLQSTINPNHIVIFKDDGIYGTLDGGTTSKQLISAAGLNSAALHGNIDINNINIINSAHPTRFNLMRNEFQLGGCVIEDDCIHSQNYSLNDRTGWVFYSDGRVVIKGEEI